MLAGDPEMVLFILQCDPLGSLLLAVRRNGIDSYELFPYIHVHDVTFGGGRRGG